MLALLGLRPLPGEDRKRRAHGALGAGVHALGFDRAGGDLFLGWPLVLLAAAAFLPRHTAPSANGPRALVWLAGDPRWSVAIGLLLVLALATGGNQAARSFAELAGEPPPPALPNLYGWLTSIFGPLQVVRVPAAIGVGFHLAVSLLAGLGTSKLLERVPMRWRALTGAALVAVVFIETLRPGLPARFHFEMRPLRPPEHAIAFFEELAALGNAGPLMELPVDGPSLDRGSTSMLLSAYHHRRTSRCYNSFLPASAAPTRRALRTRSPAAP